MKILRRALLLTGSVKFTPEDIRTLGYQPDLTPLADDLVERVAKDEALDAALEMLYIFDVMWSEVGQQLSGHGLYFNMENKIWDRLHDLHSRLKAADAVMSSQVFDEREQWTP